MCDGLVYKAVKKKGAQAKEKFKARQQAFEKKNKTPLISEIWGFLVGLQNKSAGYQHFWTGRRSRLPAMSLPLKAPPRFHTSGLASGRRGECDAITFRRTIVQISRQPTNRLVNRGGVKLPLRAARRPPPPPKPATCSAALSEIPPSPRTHTRHQGVVQATHSHGGQQQQKHVHYA